MAADPKWAVLPSVLVVDILSYLSHEDRLKASSVCKRWRNCIFHPSLWQRIHFQLSFSERLKTKFLADRCGHFVREAVVKFCSHNITEVRECVRILDILSGNKNLLYFSLQPSSCHVEWPESHSVYLFDRFLESIETIIKTSRRLRHFSLGCVEELLEHSSALLSLLGHRHGRNLTNLHLASVKEDSEEYGIVALEPYLFQPFTALKELSLDYDYLTVQLLENFCNTNKAKLETLIIHVHGIEPDHERIHNSVWRTLRNYSPDLEVTLNLVHSFDGVDSLLDILQPCMPLAHFRQFFCSNLNTTAITYFSTHYRDTLKSVYIIDGLTDGYPIQYTSNTEEDPFVMLAWRCFKLEKISIIGYEIADDDVIAMARLRGSVLKEFNIPKCCIASVDEEEDNVWVGHGCVGSEFNRDVSKSLSCTWKPVEDEDLPCAVYDAEADAEEAYMDILLLDQQIPSLRM